MNIMMVLNTAALLVCLVGAPGCGKASVSPVEAAPPTETTTDGSDTNTPPPEVTVLTFIYQNSIGICDALEHWNPETETVVFPANSGNTGEYSFEASGVYSTHPDGTHRAKLAPFETVQIVKDGALNHPAQCTITVTNGELVSVL